MEFRISDTFTASLAKLNAAEQKAAKTTVFDLQVDPKNPGMSFHRIDKSKDDNFWSVRVSRDIRIIVHQTAASLLMCYVDHHDDAYRWAERRKVEVHPKTGAAQLVEVRERVQEITVPVYVEVEQPVPELPPLFADVPPDDLLSYGVPPEWLDDVRTATEDTLFELSEHLPHEAAEALLQLATGAKPIPLQEATAGADPFAHPDAQRRFRVMTNVEELERALEYPWEKWTVFLHPGQQELVERQFNGPARVSGSAGTGKTIVALHRAVHLARQHPEAKVLLATFSATLARSLAAKLVVLVGNEPKIADRIHVESTAGIARQLYHDLIGEVTIAPHTTIQEILKTAATKVDGHKFSDQFLWAEWTEVVDAWQLTTWETYRKVTRLGRKTRLSEKHREIAWSIFAQVREELEQRNLTTMPTVFGRVAEALRDSAKLPFDFAVVDEAQDVSVPELRFLAALGAARPDGLFFTGDLGQRIFQAPFSWKELGVDIRGRSRTLRINYRTSHQIRGIADRLLPPEVSDVDGNTESRRGTVSVFNGPTPVVQVCDDESAETATVSQWLLDRIAEGVQPHEVGLFVRSAAQLPRAQKAARTAAVAAVELDDEVETKTGHISISTMHLAKGLEFRAVVVMACDDEILPLQDRIETVADDSDLEEVYNTERHLLYVACTRARDQLLVTGVEPASEFLDDLCK
ncbi:ATP-dependent DNA helicase PcrA [Symmachiella dynata]|uniref:DNA 3'-5' helicase n=1 Tax=Symmachiella dynata TaxID=2527995 RepID=A0A517ZQ31_9PLAN|nr:3'-5' exonuclease [Symmachiella dynata]QDU44581.1 ATP-dependent DNA helicase PcrA [Symmachiella dynata]